MRLLAFTAAALVLAAAPSVQAATTCAATAHKLHRHHRVHRVASHCSCRRHAIQRTVWRQPEASASFSGRARAAYEYVRGAPSRTEEPFADPAVAPPDVGPDAPGPNSPYADLAR